MSEEKVRYVVQSRCVGLLDEPPGPWIDGLEDYPDIYKAIHFRDGFDEWLENTTEPLAAALKKMVKLFGGKMECRIIKRTTVDEIIEDVEKVN